MSTGISPPVALSQGRFYLREGFPQHSLLYLQTSSSKFVTFCNNCERSNVDKVLDKQLKELLK